MRRLIPLAVLGLVAAGCGGSKTVTVTTTRTITVTTTAPAAKVAARVYLLRDGKVAPVAREVPSTRPADLLAALAKGPTQQERSAGLTTADPTTRAGLAQAVYTLSQLAPGSPVDYRGRTYTRADFEAETPVILVESPLPFAAVSSPLRVTGTANTFEATFEYELLDPAARVLAKHFVTATSGSGTRGTFDFTIRFSAPDGVGKLVVYESSAADGSRIHQVEIPLSGQ
jgi:Immunoglobulin-like domain of bacterial spore germination